MATSYKDAIFVSPHKLIGGPGTPGVLIIRRELLTNSVPAVVGGGTVSFVNPVEHKYLDDPEHREEGGTPAIIESIRAGLVFQLKERVGVDAIRAREESFIQRAIERWRAHPNVEVLGNPDAERLSIVSFVIRFGGRYLHHNYVVALLNDVFGIQGRGGCSCAGPYGHDLLGIDLETSHQYEEEILHGCEGIKPGWVRVNFNYFISEDVFEYIVRAVELIADRGWTLLPYYTFDPNSGLWRHRDGLAEPPLSLHDIRYEDGALQLSARAHDRPVRRPWPATSPRPRRSSPRPRRPIPPPSTSSSAPGSKPSAGSRCRKNSEERLRRRHRSAVARHLPDIACGLKGSVRTGSASRTAVFVGNDMSHYPLSSRCSEATALRQRERTVVAPICRFQRGITRADRLNWPSSGAPTLDWSADLTDGGRASAGCPRRSAAPSPSFDLWGSPTSAPSARANPE